MSPLTPREERDSPVTGQRRTGYYVAGRDWPAIGTAVPAGDILAALEAITDADVDAALASLEGDR